VHDVTTASSAELVHEPLGAANEQCPTPRQDDRGLGGVSGVGSDGALVWGAAGAATQAATPQAAVSTGEWQPLSVSPLPFYPQAAMLLADGSVMLREVTRRR